MDLDRRQSGQLEGVADRVGVVRPGARIEDQPIRQTLEPVQPLDELALVVGLEEPGLEAELAALLADPELELVEAQRAVVLRVTTTELVQMHAVHDLAA